MTTPKKPRGFAAMSPEKAAEIRALGNKARKPENQTFAKDRALAAIAGRKGGSAKRKGPIGFARDNQLAVTAGRKGAAARRQAIAKATPQGKDES